MEIKVTNIQFVPIKPQSGLIGFCSCEINELFFIGSLGVYTNLGKPGSYRVTYPCKKLANGQLVEIFSPISEELNKTITDAISKKVSSLLDLEETNIYVENN